MLLKAFYALALLDENMSMKNFHDVIYFMLYGLCKNLSYGSHERYSYLEKHHDENESTTMLKWDISRTSVFTSIDCFFSRQTSVPSFFLFAVVLWLND